jgi:hypothetical protein
LRGEHKVSKRRARVEDHYIRKSVEKAVEDLETIQENLGPKTFVKELTSFLDKFAKYRTMKKVGAKRGYVSEAKEILCPRCGYSMVTKTYREKDTDTWIVMRLLKKGEHLSFEG